MYHRKKNLKQVLLFVFVLTTYIAKGQALPKSTPLPNSTIQPIRDLKRDNSYYFKYPFTIQAQYQPAYVPLSEHLAELEYKKVNGISFDIGWTRIQWQTWQRFNCYPKIGLSVNYYQFGQLTLSQPTDTVTKQATALGAMLYVEPYHNYLKQHTCTPRLGIGIVNLNIPLDPSYSPKIEAIQGMKPHLLFGLSYQYLFARQWHFNLNTYYNYIPIFEKINQEEGSAAIDFLSIYGGIGYTFNPRNITYHSPKRPKPYRVDIGLLASRKKLHHDDAKYYPLWGIYAQYSGYIGGNSALTIGTEWIEDKALEEELKSHNLVDQTSLQIALQTGHEFIWGPLLFAQQLGIYVLTAEEKAIYKPYLRLGCSYRIMKNLLIGISVKGKPYMAPKRDFIDMRIAYSFN